MKPALLYLVHRIPYPPNKGDKIRSFNLLRVLAQDYRIFLGAFVDDRDDAGYESELSQYCEELYLPELSPLFARVRSMTGLTRGAALTVPYYRNRALARWVDGVISRHSIERAVVFSSSMGQYLLGQEFKHIRRIVDFVDVDSDKWRQYAPTRYWPMSWVFSREAEKLLQYERRLIEEFDAGLFVSRPEAELFRALAPEHGPKIDYANNGVDLEYFSPQADLPNPYQPEDVAIVFVGAMDYWPNVDAAVWFATELFPALREQHAAAKFFIVGGNPSPKVKSLEQYDGIVVTGRVEDVRPYVKYGALSVAPIRIARGVQNKVLESMAMGKATVVTPAALEGIDAEPGRDLRLAIDNQEFVENCGMLLNDQALAKRIGVHARDCVERLFDWETNLERFKCILDSKPVISVSEAAHG